MYLAMKVQWRKIIPIVYFLLKQNYPKCYYLMSLYQLITHFIPAWHKMNSMNIN